MSNKDSNEKKLAEEFLNNNEVVEDDYDDFSDMDRSADEFVNRKSNSKVSRILFLIMVIGASAFGLWLMKTDMLYYFASDAPQKLGYAERIDLKQAPDSGTLVTVRGTRELKRLELKYANKTNSFFGFFGTDSIYIMTPSEQLEQQLETFGLRSDVAYTGRLMRLGELSSYPQIFKWYKEQKGKQVSPQSLVVLEHQYPHEYWWAMAAFVLLALALLFSCYRFIKIIIALKK